MSWWDTLRLVLQVIGGASVLLTLFWFLLFWLATRSMRALTENDER